MLLLSCPNRCPMLHEPPGGATLGPMPVPDQTRDEKKSLFQLKPPSRRALCAALWIFCGSAAGLCLAQNILPDWEEGHDRPNRWQLVGTNGGRVPTLKSGSALMVQGNGRDQVFWRTPGLALKPGSVYRLSFFLQGEGVAGEGVAFAGLSRVNRDFVPAGSGQRYGFVLCVPDDGTNDFVRLGEWHVKGNIAFAQAQLLPVVAIHKQIARDAELGEGESIEGGVYRFTPMYSSPAGNYHRPLLANRASFNTDRWTFSSGEQIIYRLGPGGSAQVEGKVQAYIKYSAGGSLHVDASRDGADWVSIAVFDNQRPGGWSDLPERLFPADWIFIRLSCHGTNANLQVNPFAYESRLAKSLPDAEGETYFLEVRRSSPEVAISLRDVQRPVQDGRWRLEWTTTNLTQSPLAVQAAVGLDPVSFAQIQTQKLSASPARIGNCHVPRAIQAIMISR